MCEIDGSNIWVNGELVSEVCAWKGVEMCTDRVGPVGITTQYCLSHVPALSPLISLMQAALWFVANDGFGDPRFLQQLTHW